MILTIPYSLALDFFPQREKPIPHGTRFETHYVSLIIILCDHSWSHQYGSPQSHQAITQGRNEINLDLWRKYDQAHF